MNLRFASVLISGFVATSVVAQQQQSPFGTPQPTPPANQGVTTNPTGAGSPTQPGTTTTPTLGAFGGTATNPTASTAFGGAATNQVNGNQPLFLNVTPTTITDANGSPIGVLQQLALSPSGGVNFGLVNMGGRLVPVPWQLIVNGTTRGTLGVNADRGVLQSAPPVAVGQLPMLTQADVQAQILGHFQAQQAAAQPAVVTTGTARGGTGGAGVTITGGTTNTAMLGGTNMATTGTMTNGVAFNTNVLPNTNGIANNTRTNQAVNTTGGLLSPTGRTNGIYDGFNSGPGSTDRLGPRQNANPTQPTPRPAPPAAGQNPTAPPVQAPTVPQPPR